jgi:DNA-binding beta-propeller fold protein YncE
MRLVTRFPRECRQEQEGMKIRIQITMALAIATGACANMHTPEEVELALPAERSAALLSTSTASEETFTAFESGQVRPLSLSADGKLLFAVNTPDNRLEVFSVSNGSLKSKGAVLVGLEPVAVAVRSASEVWVVNHLSDSISVVDVSNAGAPRVSRTLLVGDEPRDIVFAGGRAYVTTAHRGQNTGRDPQLTTPGVGRADVWVFDPAALGETLAGTPVTVITLFSDTPRALAVSKDQKTVYAAAFNSGNRTAIVPERLVTNNGGMLPPLTNAAGVAAPLPAMVVKYRIGTPDGLFHWLDETARIWDAQVNFSLPDKDVFAIDASLPVPVEKPALVAAGVGTVIFNLAVNPVNGKVYASNLESRNEVRFEGHNNFGGNGSVRGHLAESRITVIDGAQVAPRHLNKHIDFTQEGTPAENAKSLASPTGMEVSKDGKLLYVAALSSSKLGIFRTEELEANTFTPNTSDQVPLTGGGPTGLALDAAGAFAYVLTRFDNGISVVNTKTKREVGHTKMYNPEPATLTKGRRFLYDAALTSAHGDSACATCHIFGDFDALVWELGDPDGEVIHNPGPFTTPPQAEAIVNPQLHPMKGPMATQSLRGMANHGPMHWRGDRTGGNDVPASAQPDTGTFDEVAAFKKFNVAFPGLLGRAAQLTDADMQAFTDFMLQVTYPPNPIRNLDNSLTAAQAAGRAFYFNSTPEGVEIPSDTFHNCNGCHTLDRQGNAEFGVKKPGFFGANGRYSFENAPQFMKVPHTRNVYQKVGMFGLPNTFGLPIDRPAPLPPLGSSLPPPLNDVSFKGDQIKGFGFTHNGDRDTLFRFFGSTAFVQRPATDAFPNPGGIPPDANGIAIRRNLEAFMMASETNLAPIVGQQITLRTNNAAVVDPRIELLKQRAAAAECELVVHGVFVGIDLGVLYVPVTGKYQVDLNGMVSLTEAQLRLLVNVSPLTFTAVPPKSGKRIAFDRDSDGALDVNGLSTLRTAGISGI